MQEIPKYQINLKMEWLIVKIKMLRKHVPFYVKGLGEHTYNVVTS